jgi:hypothetical protein
LGKKLGLYVGPHRPYSKTGGGGRTGPSATARPPLAATAAKSSLTASQYLIR